MTIYGWKCCSERETGLLSALSDDHGLTATPKSQHQAARLVTGRNPNQTFDI
jgi:hypothetical protein